MTDISSGYRIKKKNSVLRQYTPECNDGFLLKWKSEKKNRILESSVPIHVDSEKALRHWLSNQSQPDCASFSSEPSPSQPPTVVDVGKAPTDVGSSGQHATFHLIISYPGASVSVIKFTVSFNCPLCEHPEAIFAGLANHCTHHNLSVALTRSSCKLYSINSVASHCPISAHGNHKTVADASSQGSVSVRKNTVTFFYPGPFKCHACEHSEAVFARIVNHCTHHNLVVHGLTCSICKKLFNTINSVACHYPHCKKQANREPTPATVTPLDPEVTASAQNSHVCTACSRTFNTHNGLRLHEKRKHASKFMASSQAPKHHRWSDDELHDVRVILRKLEDAGSSSLAVLAEELSRLWQESISVNTAKYLRKKVRSTESCTVKSHAQTLSCMTTDCVNPQMESLSLGAKTTKSEGEMVVITERGTPKQEARKHYTDGVAQVLSTLLRPNRDGRKPPALLTRVKGAFSRLRDPKRIAAHLIKNQPLCNVSCPIDVAESALRQRLSERPCVDAAPYKSKRPPNSSNILSPISADEVTLHLKLMSARTSAGLDGVQVSHIRQCDPVCLAKAFNCFLLARHIPQHLKDCRTTLIIKTDDPRPDAEDYRPITIASCVYRLFSKIVTRRLENCIPLHPRQKAFRSGTDGAFDNITTLTTIIKEAHKFGTELNIVSVDLAKAFDTVNHSSIDRALRMQGLDSESRELIKEMVTGSTTVIKGDGGALSNKIEINQGVRQGDPIFPLLFNSVMDELIERLEQSGVGFKIGNTEVVTLAFADDIILVSSSHRGMERLLSITHDFVNERGLKLNIKKCKGIRFVRTPKTKSLVQDTSKAFKVPQAGEHLHVPMVGPGEHIKVLGVNIAPDGKPTFSLGTLEGTLERIRKAPLKPAQKLATVRDYLIPALEYQLGVPGVGKRVLEDVDTSIRHSVKRFLHLPHTGMNSMFLTMPVKDGGLGLRPLRTQHIARVAVGANSMMNSADPTSQTVARMPQHQKSLHAALKHFSVPTASKDSLKKGKRSVGNSWLSGLNGMRSRDFITGLKLRFGVIETRSQKWRGRTPQNPAVLLCRHCGRSTGQRETAAHISQKCPVTQRLYIQRHNRIVHLVGEHARREGFTVHVEHALKSAGQVYKPDLILIKGNSAHILGVAVPWEKGTDMHEHYERKTTKYSRITEDVKAHFGVDSCTVGAIVVGARSSWCASNRLALKACSMHFTKKFKRLLCRVALEGTCRVFQAFFTGTA
ncbi:Retrovirus-related Pol polyprotein from type-1 retrotransposable element [Trichinella zimbabwensis]|uniref:Retrovirus-related Pol polyprotein from type-1 retrotransposable element n=1 Tax=Trichinella zimbabwensis TaxID=268475 RepID=A0A0V1HCX1_9BILA|nr:Retrovirus-related Pol polyprotein from type-1 retrotransposable element [Trichinella zimbabwensis]